MSLVKRTQAEVEEFFSNLFFGESYRTLMDPHRSGLRDERLNVRPNGEGWIIEIKQMCEYVDVTFAKLIEISSFFGGTKAINDDRYRSLGCETCDYGSSYEVTLTVLPE